MEQYTDSLRIILQMQKDIWKPKTYFVLYFCKHCSWSLKEIHKRYPGNVITYIQSESQGYTHVRKVLKNGHIPCRSSKLLNFNTFCDAPKITVHIMSTYPKNNETSQTKARPIAIVYGISLSSGKFLSLEAHLSIRIAILQPIIGWQSPCCVVNPSATVLARNRRQYPECKQHNVLPNPPGPFRAAFFLYSRQNRPIWGVQ